VKALLSGKLPLRTNLVDLVAAIAKIEGAASEGLLDGGNYGLEPIGNEPTTIGRAVKWKIRDKYKNIFIEVIPKTNQTSADQPTSYIAVNKMNGDAFHLATVAALLAENKAILGVEAETSAQFKKSVAGVEKDIGKALKRRVDIVTGSDINNAEWHEVKSLAFNTKREGNPERRGAYKNALNTLDLPTITSRKRVSNIDELAVLGEDSDTDLVVRANQFYTKEFFVDRVFAGADTSAAQNRMRWIFQDFAKSDMNTFDSRSAAKKRDLVVANSKFMQCGVNKTTSGACSSIYGSVNPL